MGLVGMIAGQVAGKAIGAGVEYGKENLLNTRKLKKLLKGKSKVF